MGAVAPCRSVDELFATLERAAGAHDSLGPDGDPIDVLSHSLQCAHELARRTPGDVGLQVAGLVHDLGHVVAAGEAAAHGLVGAAYVRELLGGRVARLVELHVPAKQYLVATDAGYGAELSEGSARSLVAQGGPLGPAAAAAFARDPHAADACELRRADEAAKVEGRVVPGLDHWRAVVDGYLGYLGRGAPGPTERFEAGAG